MTGTFRNVGNSKRQEVTRRLNQEMWKYAAATYDTELDSAANLTVTAAELVPIATHASSSLGDRITAWLTEAPYAYILRCRDGSRRLQTPHACPNAAAKIWGKR